MSSLYLQELTKLLAKVEAHEQQAIESAAEKISQQLASHHLIHLFGCGHSHILTEEVFYRSGGLAPIHPIFVEELMLHKGASRSSQLERKTTMPPPLWKRRYRTRRYHDCHFYIGRKSRSD